jgi:amino acid adenylation domain-containing protein
MSHFDRNEIEAIYPLSPLQQGLVLHNLLAPESGVYAVQYFCTLAGDIDAGALKDAWTSVVARHGVLRTLFVLDQGDRPLQVVLKRVELPWQQEDWRETDPASHADRFQRFLDADRLSRFDLERAPLFRLALIRTGDHTHQFVWSVHHSIVDGWSIARVLGEVFGLYQAARRQKPLQLPPARPYADFIAWLGKQNAASAEAYWRGVLKGFSAPTPVPGEERRPDVNAAAVSEKLHFALDPATSASLHSLGRRRGLTMNTIVQGAWALLLSKYTGERDVVFGATVSGRPTALAESDKMIGLFINTLPVRVRFEPDERTIDCLERIQRDQVEAREYEYASLAEIQGWSETPRGQALFDTLLLYENFPGIAASNEEDASDLRVTGANSHDATHYALTLSVVPGESLALRLMYDPNRFRADAIGRMAGHLQQLLQSIAAQAEQHVDAISMLTPAEEHRMLREWNDTAMPYRRERCVHTQFEEQASRESVAIEGEGGALTYAELNRRANRIAHRLIELGVGPDVLVGICVDRTPDMVAALLGVMKAGGAYVPLDPGYPRDRLGFMIEDAAIRVLIAEQRLGDVVPPCPGTTIYLDRREDFDGYRTENPRAAVSADNLAYVIYTSGSTGRPKGVQVSHGALASFLAAMQKAPELSERDTLLSVTTLSFDIAGLELYLPLVAGARIVLSGRDTAADASQLSQLLARVKPTVMQATPATWRMLIEAGWNGTPGLKILCGGEALPRELARPLRERGACLWNLYGPTETTIWSTACAVDESDGPVSIGRPIANTRTYVLDRTLRPVAAGAVGELHIGGAGVARGYFNRPELTAERFLPDPYGETPGARMYRTGDLVRYRADGLIDYIGRADQQIKLRGFRIELGEIESVLAQHDGVRQAVALIREDEPGDPRLVAYVTAAAGSAPSAAHLREHAAAKLPQYMVPSACVVLETLPMTPNGKIDRKALPAPEGSRQVQHVLVSPRTVLEERLAAVWRDVLRVKDVGIRDSFFELGGNSLLLLRVHARLSEALGRKIPLTDLFRHPTIELLAHALGDEPASEERPATVPDRGVRTSASRDSHAIAVVGLAGRFPGAENVEQFWRNLAGGVESIRFFSDEELLQSGIPERVLNDPNYVKARGTLEGADLFDASFFGYTPREAELMDPQQRVFLECAWEALERSGYNPRSYQGSIGVWAGSSINSYSFNLFSRPDVIQELGTVGALLSTERDYLPLRVSYKFNLRGPSVNLQTACSTALVAVHDACRSLLAHECDMALAGGVSVSVPLASGYFSQEGGIMSPDGHCRAFDAKAAGTLGGNGVGIVVLKRLDAALEDGDTIHAVIRGTAVNNDGSVKVGFTAPSVSGQAEVISAALASGGIDPASIGYIEAHGTGTGLGDPIEVQALTQVFAPHTPDRGVCALGSVKTNIGHLDAAAGIAGLIKAVLALRHRQLPPSLHFEVPNPHIDFDAGPFYVNTTLRPWDPRGGHPRRAGVSSYGLGGTNAHAIVEEAPEAIPSTPGRDWQVLLLSAKTDAALQAHAGRLAEHLRAQGDTSLADAAFTLQVGRDGFDRRRAVVCRDASIAAEILEGGDRRRSWSGRSLAKPSVVFMFSGQGTQYVGMARELYETEAFFRHVVDDCVAHLSPALAADVRLALWPSEDGRKAAEQAMARTQVTQASLFIVEYALARLLMEWGIRPAAMIGHSIGEYVAACLSGVLSLDDALGLVAVRGTLMEQAPAGCMTAVPSSEARVRAMLEDGLWIAAVNAPEMCVVSGTHEAVEAFEARLRRDGIESQRLHTAGAFHSGLMDGVAVPLAAAAAKLRPGKAAIPYVSNVTGDFVGGEVQEPEYWSRHVTGAVRFADGVAALVREKANVFVEIGPGQVLGSFVRQSAGSDVAVLPTLRHAKEEKSDAEGLAAALGRLWVHGVNVDWTAYHAGERRRRVELPTYPFERQRYWIDAASRAGSAAAALAPAGRNKDVGAWFFTPEWRSQPSARLDREAVRTAGPWLVFADGAGLGRQLAAEILACGAVAIVVEPGEGYSHVDGAYRVAPDRPEDFDALVADLQRAGHAPRALLHTWALARPAGGPQHLVDRAYTSLVQFVRATGAVGIGIPRTVGVITSGVHRVIGDEALTPEAALALGPALVLPTEHEDVRCRAIDLAASDWSGDVSVQPLLAAVMQETGPAMLALRRGRTWSRTFHQQRIESSSATPRFKHRGVYLITGGYGGIGLELGGLLAEACSARLVLTGREGLPDRATWAGHRAGGDARLKRRLDAVEGLERLGAEVMTIAADVTDDAAMARVIEQAVERFGGIDGVIHAAGVPGARVMQLDEGPESAAVLAPKVTGTQVLLRALAPVRPDFIVLCSSISTLTGGMGQASYTAANAYLDAVAHAAPGGGPDVLAINWDAWREVGMAVDTSLPERLARARAEELKHGILPAEGRDAFVRLLHDRIGPQVIVSTRDLVPRLAAIAASTSAPAEPARQAAHTRPDLAQAYVAPRNPIEEEVAAVWQRLFGLAQVGVEDDFFELGGHSLLATQVMSRVREQFQVDLPLAALFEAPTVAGLSLAVMERLMDAEQTALS